MSSLSRSVNTNAAFPRCSHTHGRPESLSGTHVPHPRTMTTPQRAHELLDYWQSGITPQVSSWRNLRLPSPFPGANIARLPQSTTQVRTLLDTPANGYTYPLMTICRRSAKASLLPLNSLPYHLEQGRKPAVSIRLVLPVHLV